MAGVALTFKAHQQQHHLRFYAKVKWAQTTADECGHPIPGGGVKVDHYEIQLQPTDAAGVPAQTEDAVQGQPVPHMKRKSKKPPAGFTLTAATAASSIATFTTSKVHGFAVNDIVKVTGVHPFAYNGDWKVLSVPTTTTFTVNIGSTPAAGNTFGRVEGPPDPTLNVIFTQIPNPKKWYWRTRVRVWTDNQCPSDWSTWTAPALPYSGSVTQPPAPANVVLTFDKAHKMRHAPLRAVVTWDEVINWDTGLDKESDMGHYQIELGKSDDGVTWDTKPRTKHRAAHPKIDADHAAGADTGPTFDGGPDTLEVMFPVVHRKYFFRARVRAISRHHIKSAWSAWSPSPSGVSPSDTSIPPAPTNVDLKIQQHKARVTWDHPDESAQTWSYTPGANDAAKTEVVSEDVAFFQVQLDTNVAFNTANLQKDMFVGGTHRIFRITKPDGTGPNWHARVRSVSATHRVSAWVTDGPRTTVALPTPAAPTVAFDQLGPRHNRARVIVTASTYSGPQLAAHDDDIHHYVLQVAYAATHPGATPPAGANRHHQRVFGDETGDDLKATFHSVRKDHFVYARERVVDREGKQSAWSAWADAGSPTADTPAAPTNVVDVSTHKLVGIRWDTAMAADGIRPDESIAHYHVQVATTSAFTTIVEEAKHVIHRQLRWKATSVGVQYFMRVRAVDSLGGVSAWAPAATGLGVTAGDDGDPIGHIKKVHHPVNTPPTLTDVNYLWCNGAAVSRTTFAALFAKIGTSAGSGDGTTTFNLPNHRGKHAIGVSTSLTHPTKDLGARDDALTDATNVDHGHDPHTAEADNLDHVTDLTLNTDGTSGDAPDAVGHRHNAGGYAIGTPFNGQSSAIGTGTDQAGRGHIHGVTGQSDLPASLHGHLHAHGHGHGKGGKHPKPNQKANHGKNHAPWLAVHYIIRAQ